MASGLRSEHVPLVSSNLHRSLPARRTLEIGAPEDHLEQEADRTALRVTADLGRVPIHSPDAAGARSDAGAPLAPAVRTAFEPHVGTDLTGVRVHAGGRAHRLAVELGAQAFTVGRDLYFAAGQFAPETRAGRGLLAHELAHVAQQQRGATSAVQRKGDGLIDVEIVGRVWGEMVMKVAQEMKLSPDDPKVRAEAEARTSKQIGPGNYRNWVARTRGGEGITLDPKTQQDMEQKIDVENAPPLKYADGTPWSAGTAGPHLAKMADGLFDRTKEIRLDVARMEHECEALRTPDGVEGGLYQYVGGAVTMVAAPTLGTLDQTIGLPIEKGIGAVTGHKSKTSLGTIADDQVNSAVSGAQLMVGNLHARYLATRPSYQRFLTAEVQLEHARTTLHSMASNGDFGAEYKKAQAAHDEMFDAYREYADKCAALDIKGKAKQLARGVDLAGQGIISGMAAVIPFAGPSTKATTKMLQATEKALEKTAIAAGETAATQVAKKAPAVVKTVVEDAAVAGAKTEGKAATATVDEALNASKDAASKLENVPANDVVPPSQPATQAIPEVQELAKTGTDDVAAAARSPGASTGDQILASGGKMTGDKAQFLRVNKIANQAGFYVKEAAPTARDLKAVSAYYKAPTPQLGGTAGHAAAGMAPKGADVVFMDTVGELKMLTVVSRDSLEKAFAQAMRYANKLGKKDVVVRVMDMTNGKIYDFFRK